MSNPVKKLSVLALLAALALIIFIVEAQFPPPVPVPGVKLGLANTITLFALFWRRDDGELAFCAKDAFMILLCRIILGTLFTGRAVALFYSLTGGILSFTVQIAMRRFVTARQIWVLGVTGAVAHNIGQILAAIFIVGSFAIAAYLPLLIIAGILTGVITGLCAQFAVTRVKI